MASSYWVGGSGNWSDNTNHWANSSGGTPGSSGVPSSSTTAVLDSNSFPSGGTCTFDVDVDISELNFLAGSIDTNGKNFTSTIGISGYASSNVKITTTRSLALGASVCVFGDFLISTDNLTFNAGTSSVTINKGLNGGLICDAGLSWYDVILQTSASIPGGDFGMAIVGANTFHNLTITAVDNINHLNEQGILVMGNQVISGTLTGTGISQFRRLMIATGQWNSSENDGGVTNLSMGTPYTLSSASVSLTDVDFMDITGSGSATWSGTSIGDSGGNSGITFQIPRNMYWVGNGGDWNDTAHWATSSGGSGGNDIPLPQDSVFFDTNSITSSSQTITFQLAGTLGKNVDFNGILNNPTLQLGTANDFPIIYGSLVLGTGMILGFPSNKTFLFWGRSNPTLTTNNVSMEGGVIVQMYNSTLSLVDDYIGPNDSSIINIETGTFDANFRNVTVAGVAVSGICHMRSGVWTILFQTSTSKLFITQPGSTIYGETSTLVIQEGEYFSSGTERKIDIGGSGNFHNLTIAVSTVYTIIKLIGICDNLTISNSFIDPDPAEFDFGGNFMVNDTLSINGVSGGIIQIYNGTLTAGMASVSYVNVSDNIAMGIAIPFSDFPGGVDGGGNTNWIFSANTWSSGGTGATLSGNSGSSVLFQNIGAANNTSYTVTIDFGNTTGSVLASIGSYDGVNGTTLTGPGVVSGTVTQGTGDGNLYLYGTSPGGNGTIYSISAHEGVLFALNQVYWIDLITNLPNNQPCFTTWLSQNNSSYSMNESLNIMLMVNQQSNITEWSGGVGILAAASSNSILLTSNTASTVISVVPFNTAALASFSGSSTTAGNSVASGTTAQGYPAGYILMPNNPSDGDTLTLTINGEANVLTFRNVITGQNPGSVLRGVDAGTTTVNLLGLLQNPTQYGMNFIPLPNTFIPYFSYDGSQPVSGTTTTVGNSVLTNTGASTILLPVNPADGDTMSLNLNGISVPIQFVDVIGAVAGNVLIGVDAPTTETNLLGLLEHPATTNATQVAFSTQNQLILGTFTVTQTSTVTLKGTDSWIQKGFYSVYSNRSIVINGNIYSYSGGESTNTITGVSPSPAGEIVGSVIHQNPITTQNSLMTDLPSTFRNDIISSLGGAQNETSSANGGQIFVGSYLSNIVFKSKIDDYKDYSQSSPREPGEGYTFPLDGLLTGLFPQEDSMYASWGLSGWSTFDFATSLNASSGDAEESVSITPLKIGTLQSALSQPLIVNIGNDLMFVTNEPTVQTLGRVSSTITTPQLTNMSDSIKNDMDSYQTEGFLGGDSIYWKYYYYMSLPDLGIVRRYNISMGWWEPPFIMPISFFSIINGLLYGHDSNTDQSYLIDTGNIITQANTDNGNPMSAIAAFSYDQNGDPAGHKTFVNYYLEGYISSNTNLIFSPKFDFGGFNGIPSYIVYGTPVNDPVYRASPNLTTVFFTTADGSLGKNPLGEEPIGSITDSILNLPKFRVIKTGNPTNYFEYQPYFSTNDTGQQWALLRFGPQVEPGSAPSEITE